MCRPGARIRVAAAAALTVLASCAADAPDPRAPAAAIGSLELYPGLEATLFASEPLLSNPTNMDIDERGRVWVCDVVNYREHGRSDRRPAGDRILILEDTDGDGVADTSKVYYQGRDIDAALGIAVLGNQVIVTAAPNVLVFFDEDGDDLPDRKEILFTQSGAPQNDHSTHSLSFGPDGSLYWNMGNSGRHVHDRTGRLVVDRAGHPVVDRNFIRRLADMPVGRRSDLEESLAGLSSPYQGGMAFRSGLDGGGTEVLGHNFRNNYELAVDSLGGLWQSDNDNDGSYACRINYILEYGNYGYRDEVTGAGNQVERTGQHEEVPHRHWHQNDPGVVPNLLITGAGSPTGITSYEGRLLPELFWDQILATDAGPGVLRGIVAQKEGAGYTARAVNILKGERDRWVRPVDVAVAPDGSVFVTDWYDPVIGWNRQADSDRGRVFRIAPTGRGYHPPSHDFDSVAGAVEALRSPTYAVRYLAWQTLASNLSAAEPALMKMFDGGHSLRHRARALWLLARSPERGVEHLARALRDPAEDIRVVAIRAARRSGLDMAAIVDSLASDSSAHVRRECAIALRNVASSRAAETWARLAARHSAGDRWSLEALGIAADGRWDSFLQEWLVQMAGDWDTPSGRDIIWRSRAAVTPEYLARILRRPGREEGAAARYLRAFDFQSDSALKRSSLRSLAFGGADSGGESPFFVAAEAVLRLPDLDLTGDGNSREAVARLLERGAGTPQFARIVRRFKLSEYYPALVEVASRNPDNPVGIESARTLLEAGLGESVIGFVRSGSALSADAVAALGNTRSDRAAPILRRVLLDADLPLRVRERAVRSLAGFSQGAETIVDLAREGAFPVELAEVAGAAISRSMHVRLRDEASGYFPVPPLKNRQPLPQMTELLVYEGDAVSGARVFDGATCPDCHVVNGTGTNFGPELSRIGDKLSKAGIYEAILDPSAGVSPDFDLVHLALAGQEEASGFVISETADVLTLRMEGGAVSEFDKSRILDRRTSSVSAMPDDLQEQMSLDELVDLVEYLSRLR